MEEKRLYFEPEFSGKKKRKKEKSEKKNHKLLKLFFFLLFLLIITLIIIWLLRGSKTVSGQYPENVKNESLTCISKTIIPPRIYYIDSKEKELRINAVFNGTDNLKSLSLIYTLNYDDVESAYAAEAKGHAEFNKTLASSNYPVDKFSNKFARYDEKLIISLSASKIELDGISASYFVLDLGKNREMDLETLKDFKKNYESQGFLCNSTVE